MLEKEIRKLTSALIYRRTLLPHGTDPQDSDKAGQLYIPTQIPFKKNRRIARSILVANMILDF